MTENVLWRIRAEALKVNLQNTHERLKGLPSLAKDLDEISEDLKQRWQQARAIKKQITMWEDDYAENNVPPARDAMDKAGEELGRLADKIGALQKAVGLVKERSFVVKEQSIGADISLYLRDRANRSLQSLSDIENNLGNQIADAKAWREFQSVSDNANKSVFSECVELLGGIALRDARFDLEICDLADHLIRPTYQPKPELAGSLRAIPGGVQVMVLALERVIRLRFPEWSIWALPFAAHEFWHAAAGRQLEKRLEEAIKFQGTSPDQVLADEGMQLCLADAFATYTMGPAYAYAAITLSLDPTLPCAAPNQAVCDDVRVCAILQMLKCMNQGASGVMPSYAKDSAELQQAWNAAREQALPVAGQSPEELERRNKDQERVIMDRNRAISCVRGLWHVLRDIECTYFTLEAWDKLSGWPQHLLNDTVDRIELPPDAEIRQALNAAWLARVSPARPPNLDLHTLTERALSLARRIKDRPSKGENHPRSALGMVA